MKVKKSFQKTVINIILVCTTFIITIWLGMEEYKDNKVENEVQSYETQTLSSQSNHITENKEEQNQVKAIEKNSTKEVKKEYPQEEILQSYQGYPVEAKLEIPTISLETYILKEYSAQALNISVTKFWGVNANEIGNFCVAGHNFQNKNMFRNLKKLEIGNTLWITDNKIGKVEYTIFEKYTVLPEDVTCLLPNTKGEKEVTLITCTSDSKKRIIVKAKEVK